MNKKIILIAVIALVVILALGFVAYKYLAGPSEDVQNLTGGAQVQNDIVNVDQNGVTAEPTNGGGSFNICQDKCGDGICQKVDPKCEKDINLGCVCLETMQDCPQDCKQ